MRLISLFATDFQWHLNKHYLSILFKMSNDLCSFFLYCDDRYCITTLATLLPVDANFVLMQLYFQHLQ